MAAPPNLERDSIVLGDLKNFRRLIPLVSPDQHEIRLHAAALRRLLVDGGGLLVPTASSRGLPLAFHIPDSMDMVRGVRNGHIAIFVLGGFSALGVHIGSSSLGRGNHSAGSGKVFPAKLDTFLKQVVASYEGQMITRHDVISYVSNKAGGVHFDPRGSGALSAEKMAALARLRRSMDMRMLGDVPAVGFTDLRGSEDAEIFRHAPGSVDAVYLEFLAAIQYVVDSPEVQAIEAAIERDLNAHG